MFKEDFLIHKLYNRVSKQFLNTLFYFKHNVEGKKI